MALDKNHYVGQTLPGGFHVERFVGSGAFAYVYYATGPSGQGCAVKVQYNLVSDARIRFNREIKVLKEIPPNDYLVKYYSDGVTPEGFPYLIMEFVDGTTLKEALKRRKVWPERECCELMLQLCDAFGGLHQMGIVHRDVKPDNIMLTKSNQVKLMDLGLIKDAQGIFQLLESEDAMEGQDFKDNLDKGVLAGTPEYMAPEQFSDPSLKDDTLAKTDTWTDVYSLGLIFYEMLVGKKLFVFSPPSNAPQSEFAKALLAFLQQRTQQNDDDIVQPPMINNALWSIISHALHADPTTRPLNASELATDIRHYLTTGEGVVELSSEKTNAIDLADFLDALKAQGGAAGLPQGPSAVTSALSSAKQVELQRGGMQQSPQPSQPIQSVSGMPNIPGQGYMGPNGMYQQNESSDNNFWLWLILILLLVFVLAALVFILFFID